VKLARKGQAFWGCCPFHQEKLASFKVMNALKERYAGQMDFGKASGTVKTLLTAK
jgi:hypothetical protein